MKQSLIGYNIHAEVEGDSQRSTSRSKLLTHLSRVQPRLLLVINRADFAIELAKFYPKTTVLIRYYPDGTTHLPRVDNQPNKEYKSPSQWIAMVEKDWNKAQAVGVSNVAFCTLNEPGDIPAIVKWHTNLDVHGKPNGDKGVMDLAAEKGIPLSVCHLAIGAIQENQFREFRPILRKIAQHDALFAFAAHEYFTALPSSGMPHLDSAGSPYFEIAAGNWPRLPEEPRWHAGRHQFLLDVCDSFNIPRPRLHITEAGADRLDEGGAGWVAKWLNSLKITPGYLNIRGWRSCWAQWKEWYPDWKPGKAYFEMMRYLAEDVWGAPYKGKPRRVEGVCMFSWWNSGVLGTEFDWSQFRVDNDDTFLTEHEQYILETTPPPTEPPAPPAPPAEGIPAEGWYDADVLTEDEPANIYSAERGGAILKAIPAHTRKPARTIYMAGSARQPIDYEGVRGWIDEFYGWFEPAEPPFNILPGDARWKPYRFFTNGQTAIVYKEPLPKANLRIADLHVGGVVVDHIPYDLLTPVEKTYVDRAQGTRWAVVQLSVAGIGFVREREVTRRDPIGAPVDTVPKPKYDELKQRYDELQAERDTLKQILATSAAWKMAVQAAYGKIAEGRIDLENLMHEESLKEKVS